MLHGWLKEALALIVQSLPEPSQLLSPQENQRLWHSWQKGLKVRFTLPEDLPPLRMVLVLDNLAGHKTPELVLWLCTQGIMPLYTPLGGSWLNMAESIQRILKRRALEGHHPQMASQINEWLEAVAGAWNQHPTAFVWGGKRAQRRDRARQRLHIVGGSGACTYRSIQRTTKRYS